MSLQSDRKEEIAAAVRDYLLREVLPGEDPSALTESTPLVSSGVLDSISTARLVSHLENQFGIRLKASEVNAAHLNTLSLIVETVQSKLNS